MLDVNKVKACLRLFKGYLPNCTNELDVCKTVLEFKEDMLKRGLLFVTKTTEDIPPKVVELAVNMYGVKEEEWNQTFHKSFATVRDTDYLTLVVQQLVHYITTYGFEELGIYDKDTVYIPKEELDIPELDRDISLVIIKEITEDELSNKLISLLTSGIALSKQTVEDIMNLSDYIPKDRFDEVINKEVRIILYDKYDIVPRNNVEFLRYMIYKLTGSTLLINNKQTIRALKNANTNEVYKLLNSYLVNTPNAYIKLAEIFLRYKNLFLALKRETSMINMYGKVEAQHVLQINKFINKISKLAKKYHKPLKSKILDNLTQIETIEDLDRQSSAILEELNNITIFRELRILSGLKYRLQKPENMLYRIRNGKAFLKEFNDVDSSKCIVLQNIYNLIYSNIVNKLTPSLKGKKVYIPSGINYTLPTSEKQFSGNIPQGSYIEIPRTTNMVVGVHWDDVKEGRVDLDLHAQNKDEQFGWNTSYRSTTEQQFYYSGDITRPDKEYGATEVFYIGHTLRQKAFLLTLNNYASPSTNIPYEFIISETGENQVDKNYTVDPNKVKCIIKGQFTYVPELHQFEAKQKVLAYIIINENSIKLYFNDFSLGQSNVTRRNNVNNGVFDCLYLQTESQVMLKQVLQDCGVEFTDSPTYDEFIQDEVISDETKQPMYRKITHKVDYDLSLENIDKTTFIDLLSK